MNTYKITLEVVLKDTPSLFIDDFIYRAIEEQLETGEQITDYYFAEVSP
jgi:hypothetical protein